MEKTDTATLQDELAIARVSWKRFVIKPYRIRIPSKNSEVGWGGYATVHRATLGKRWRRWITGPVAIKKLSVPGDREGRLRVVSILLQELKIWEPLKHPNVLPFRGFHISDDLNEIWLVSDLAAHGNLYTYLESGDHPLDERLSLAKDTADGINYLHTRIPPICHGDIKSLNVLIGANKRGLICDFGTAREEDPTLQTQGATPPRGGGTTRYSSPELFEEGTSTRPTRASDVWSWGCLCHEIVTGLGPYKDVVMEAQVIHCISARVPPAPLDQTGCPNGVRELLGHCWRFSPDQRPIMSECVDALRGAIIQSCRERSKVKGPQSAEGHNADANLERLEGELNEVLESLEDHRIEPSSITFQSSGGVVGQGGYGIVVLATMEQKGKPKEVVAVKKLRANGGRERRLQMIIAVARELKVTADLDHPNILPFLGFHVAPSVNETWLVSPFIPDGDLGLFLQHSTLSNEDRMKLALDTARGLEYLHSRSICHGDIKSPNVLVRWEKRRQGTLPQYAPGQQRIEALLCDFGLAKSMESMPTGLTTTTFNEGGTLAYESPELVVGRSRRSPASDIWAWGCVLYEIFTGNPPYHWANNAGAIVKWITTGIPPGVLVEGALPQHIRQLLVFCWQPEVSRYTPIIENVWALEHVEPDRREKIMRMRLMRSELDFPRDNTLGSSAHGTVYRGTMTRQGSNVVVQVALKGSPPADSENERERLFRKLENSAAVWDDLRHPNVLPFIGFSIDPLNDPEILVASPFAAGGNLNDFLKRASLSYVKKLELAKGIADGLLYLHTRSPPIYHGNLHSRNILMDHKGIPMLSDYGLDEAGSEPKSPADVEPSFRLWSPGVKARVTREVHEDVWSWGCVLLEIATGRVSYDAVGGVPAAVDDLDCPPRVKNLLGLCWKKDQGLRPTISEILAILGGRPYRYETICHFKTDLMECWSLSRDGTKLALVYWGRVEVLSTHDGSRLLNLHLPGMERPTCVQFSPSGRFLVVGTTEGLVVWDVSAAQIPPSTFGYDKVCDADISGDDTLVASVSRDGSICLFCLRDLKLKRQIVPDGKATLVVFSPMSDIIAAGLDNGGLQIFNAGTGESLAILGDEATIHSLSFSSDGRWLMEEGGAGLRKWDISRLTKSNPEAIFHDEEIRGILVPLDESGTVAVIDESHDMHIYTNCFGGPIIRHKIGSLPRNIIRPRCYHKGLGQGDDDVKRLRMGIRISAHTANGVGLMVHSQVAHRTMFRVYNFGSYDYPGTYRFDSRPDESFAYSDNQG